MASAKSTTRKLTGRAKANFFAAGLTAEEATAAVTSLRVRKDAWPVSRDLRSSRSATNANPAKSKKTTTAKKPAPPPRQAPPPPKPEVSQPQSDSSFDAFVFGLVPTFKRQGADGLMAKLDEIDDVDNLRAMAKAQQIVLPKDVRRGETTVKAVRNAILRAVEERVTDRKAQM